MIERTSIDLGSLEAAAGNAAFVMALRGRGLRDTAVLRAMEQVPRDA
ncbi:MAG: protein-L-isoaspartate O-methyltransferase, partial [Hyphomicrobiales bacterium]